MIKKIFLIAATLLTFTKISFAQTNPITANNPIDELNPFAPDIAQQLKTMDENYERETGQSPIDLDLDFNLQNALGQPTCVQMNCEIYVQIVKSQQRLYLYIQGVPQGTWAVSTGLPSHETPLMNLQPNGRIYDAYSSSTYPGGSYNGLGNMPYAVFLKGGFALHGTVEANWPHLGSKASHGCIRMHPENAFRLNRLIRTARVTNTWVSIQN